MVAICTAMLGAAAEKPSFEYLKKLTDNFGPRLTGSEGERRAAEWALAQMRTLGLTGVRGEEWMLERGWTAEHARARLVRPFELELAVQSYGWTGATPGAVAGEVVVVDGSAPVEDTDSSGWKGKILLLKSSRPDLWAEKAQNAQAVAIIDGIDRPGTMLLHTGPLGFPGKASSLPVLDMPKTQRQLLKRQIQAGVRPLLEIDVANHFTAGPVRVENVVGEIAGTAQPEEIILLGAHLDSWDLSTGATDDGVGVATVLGAANLIAQSKVSTKRTIRFVLFTGEEEGLLGSRAYVRRHEAEMPNLVCAFALDWGAGPIIKVPLAGHPEMRDPLEKFLMSDTRWKDIVTSPGFLTFTDAFSFSMAGVPGIAPLQNSPDYGEIAHSPADLLDKVDREALEFNTQLVAGMAVWLANSPKRPGTRFSSSQTQRSLEPLRPLLSTLGLSKQN